MDNNYKKIELNINVKDAKPTKPDFKWLGITVGTVLGFFAFTYICFSLFANLIVANISIEQEKKIFGDFFKQEIGVKDFDYNFKTEIPEFKNYNILISDDEEKNAYAILGANIVITKGLIENIKYEEELQFIISHEIGHIKTRDNLKSLARDLPFKITLFFIGFDIDLGFTNFSSLALNSFSRKTELEADNNALKLLKKNKINSYCAIHFFQELENFPIGFMSTHPVNQDRIKNIENKSAGKKSFNNCKKIKK